MRSQVDIAVLKQTIADIWAEHPEYTVAEAMAEGSRLSEVPLSPNDFYQWRSKDPTWKKLTDEHMERRTARLRHNVSDIYSRIPAIRLRLAKHSLNQLIPLSKVKWASTVLAPPNPEAKKKSKKTYTPDEVAEAEETIRKYQEEPWEFEMEGTQIGASSLLISKYDSAAKTANEVTAKATSETGQSQEVKITFES